MAMLTSPTIRGFLPCQSIRRRRCRNQSDAQITEKAEALFLKSFLGHSLSFSLLSAISGKDLRLFTPISQTGAFCHLKDFHMFQESASSYLQFRAFETALEQGRPIDRKSQRRRVQCRLTELDSEWQTSLSYEQVVTLQAQEEESLLFRNGPPPGDVAEVEAFCRIYRVAEQLHAVVMDALRSLSNTEESVGSEITPIPSERGDVSEAEERVVTGLAQIGAMLQQFRRSVLSGTSPMAANRVESNSSEDPIPPLAKLRGELKDACLQLQDALEAGLPPEGEITLAVKRRLERLKNVCLDAGFPRLEGSPSHADIPNFAAVRLRPFRSGRKFDSNEEVAFWRGGQVTEEGLSWLLDRGFKTIVDVRADDVGNQWIKPAIQELKDSDRINYVRLPVTFGTAPTMEQVELFARLVTEKSNQPLYLHSQGGVGRACGMVSRWREFVLRGGLEAPTSTNKLSASDLRVLAMSASNGKTVAAGTNRNFTTNQGVPDESREDWTGSEGSARLTDRDGTEEGRDAISSNTEQFSDSDNHSGTGNESAGFERSGEVLGSFLANDEMQVSENGPASVELALDAFAQAELLDARPPVGIGELRDYPDSGAREGLKQGKDPETSQEAGHSIQFVKSAFHAQVPTSNVLSKRAMSTFLKSKKVGPNSLLEINRQKLLRKTPQSQQRTPKNRPGEDVDEGTITGLAGRWALAEPGIPRAGRSYVEEQYVSSSDSDEDAASNGRIRFVSRKSDGTYVLSEAASIGAANRRLDENRTAALASQKEVELKADEVSSRDAQTSEEEAELVSKQSPTYGALLRVVEEDASENGVNGAIRKESSNGATIADDAVEGVPFVNGDMCASTTGVVRLQSRRKAEMYLVRTDGFSCTRERVKESTLAFTHPSTQQQMLMWKTPPKTCLLLKKLGSELMDEAQQVASWLYYQEGINVVVEPELHDRFARIPGFGFVQTYYNQDTSKLHERVDFVVCLGGDGVILHASNLFRSAVPPVVSFNLGSLGFLTAHPFEEFKLDLKAIIHGNSTMDGVYITLRMRLRCELFRNGKPIPGKVFDVLNEVVVDRGSNPYLCKIECYERNRLITKVQADGVLLATPTGSTAYSTAAGGSMVHPNVPCMLFTPICPHSLSFRPVILPDSALVELKTISWKNYIPLIEQDSAQVPTDARNNAWVSFDGKKRQQLSKGDSVRVCMSEHPMPTVNKSDQTDDWFRSLVRCLSWNERMEQKALIIPS